MGPCSSKRKKVTSDIICLFPANYEPVKILGEGCFGQVLKTIKKDTQEIVAVKVLHQNRFDHELHLLKLVKSMDLDQCNIVRYIDSFILKDCRVAIVLEMLEMTLLDFMMDRGVKTLQLHEVRSIIQQMATALESLKRIHVIHSDIKLDNIMFVDHKKQPLRVKLVDFGEGFPTHEAKRGNRLQAGYFRAPEIILGLPFSEAIDMWSLGIVMLIMVFGFSISPNNHLESTIVEWMVHLLGIPPNHLLDAGIKSNFYFHRSPNGQWRLTDVRHVQSFDKASLKKCLRKHSGDKEACIDLLLAMLEMDPKKRINPTEVLAHQFITGNV